MSIKELQDEISAYNKNHEEQIKEQITLLYKQSYWIAIGFNDPKKFPQLNQEFPDLFDDEEPETPEIKSKKKRKKKPEQWEIDKMNMTLFAQAYNSSRRAGQ